MSGFAEVEILHERSKVYRMACKYFDEHSWRCLEFREFVSYEEFNGY